MGTIIRITGDGVFIESNPKISSMETCSSNLLKNNMCNIPKTVDNVIDSNKIQQHTIMYDRINFVDHQMTCTKSSEKNCRGQCY